MAFVGVLCILYVVHVQCTKIGLDYEYVDVALVVVDVRSGVLLCQLIQGCSVLLTVSFFHVAKLAPLICSCTFYTLGFGLRQSLLNQLVACCVCQVVFLCLFFGDVCRDREGT